MKENFQKKTTTMSMKSLSFSFSMFATVECEWKISLHIHIVASWIHSPTVSYCYVIACSSAICCWCTRPVHISPWLFPPLTHSNITKHIKHRRKLTLCTNLHVTIICVWQLQPLHISRWVSHRNFFQLFLPMKRDFFPHKNIQNLKTDGL